MVVFGGLAVLKKLHMFATWSEARLSWNGLLSQAKESKILVLTQCNRLPGQYKSPQLTSWYM